MCKVCLVIIDGFGIADGDGADATKHAGYIEAMKKKHGWARLRASGRYVGLPPGFGGNSEAGHMTIGSGRRIEQSLLRINRLWREGEFAGRIEGLALTPRVHIIGLLSDGGVHSHIEHLRFLLASIPGRKLVHAIADGIDTPPDQFFRHVSTIGCELASISGRHYAMDRDGNMDRTHLAFSAMAAESSGVVDISPCGRDAKRIIAESLEIPKSERELFIAHAHADEYIPPVRVSSEFVRPDDTVIFYNFRADRMRQLVSMFRDFARVYTMTDYGLGGPSRAIFEAPAVKNTLPEWLGRHSATQAHIAESEKYAHVTYFFNGGCEARQPGEARKLVKSPSVRQFDEQPGTSMREVGSECILAISQSVDFVLVNLAAPDLVGHSGNFEAAVEAVKEADSVVEAIHGQCSRAGYALMITADHGNSEQMVLDGKKCKSHTNNDVPLLILGASDDIAIIQGTAAPESGELADIAPTVLDIMGLPIPADMGGRSLVARKRG